MIKKVLLAFLPVFDFLYLPLVALAALVLKLYRRLGSQRLTQNTKTLKILGLFPIRDHYYEPLFNHTHLTKPLGEKRFLPGLNFRHEEQILFLRNLNYQNEFEEFLEQQRKLGGPSKFVIDNGSFESGDAEFLFNFVRYIKPNRVIEIGSGSSTKIISSALGMNAIEVERSSTHICIEPYEQPWLDSFSNIEVLRNKVENIDLKFFKSLSAKDLLFIDSSHIIRPQGDVLREYLEIIPSLKTGLFVHVHDIFTPNDYPENWIKENVLFWNEQYLLEATMSNNPSYEIIAALNYLKHEDYQSLKRVCPYLNKSREPGSFYFKIA